MSAHPIPIFFACEGRRHMEACSTLVGIRSSCWLLLSMAGGCWGNSKMAWVRNQMEPCGSSSGLTPLTAFLVMFLGGWVPADTDLSRTGGFSWHLMPMCAWGCTEADFNLTGGFSWHVMPMCAWGCKDTLQPHWRLVLALYVDLHCWSLMICWLAWERAPFLVRTIWWNHGRLCWIQGNTYHWLSLAIVVLGWVLATLPNPWPFKAGVLRRFVGLSEDPIQMLSSPVI